MAVKYLSGNRLWGTNAERTGMSTTAFPKTGWKELDRYTVSGAAVATMDTGTFTAKDNLMILVHGIADDTYITGEMQFNGETGSKYAWTRQKNGGGDDPQNTEATIPLIDPAGTETTMWSVSTVRNMSGREKFVISENMSNYSGSGTAPRRYEVVAKYVPDSLTTPITSVQIISTSSQDFAIGSEVVVLGYDDDEADSGTDNFWQQIASGTDSSGSLTTGAFTAKKYMLVTTHLNASSNASGAMQFNTDVDSHYNARFSEDGGDDSDWGLAGGIAFGRACSSNSPSFGTTFIVNKSDQSKLAISHDSTNKSGTGASDAPQGQETVGLWDNQLAQITNVKIVDGQGIGNTPWTSGSKIFVWGSD